ncbi:unnamed protein product [Dovyalis caffra]|uniref:Uncharacterized protein n=1 Tax=Dovyalis caffra TaxID=77055 RepID=A0AAV1QW01_9ROSI|nr:unnamed protein product [Dovyalis caffra]
MKNGEVLFVYKVGLKRNKKSSPFHLFNPEEEEFSEFRIKGCKIFPNRNTHRKKLRKLNKRRLSENQKGIESSSPAKDE